MEQNGHFSRKGSKQGPNLPKEVEYVIIGDHALSITTTIPIITTTSSSSNSNSSSSSSSSHLLCHMFDNRVRRQLIYT